jgi:hypothetical protein
MPKSTSCYYQDDKSRGGLSHWRLASKPIENIQRSAKSLSGLDDIAIALEIVASIAGDP